MKCLPLLASPVTLLALAGCPDRSVSKVDPDQAKVEQHGIPLNRDIDILFVIDNSGSMADEQTRLAARFPDLVAKLQQFEGGMPDVHIGVVSSDVGIGPHTVPGCSAAGDGGQLQVPPACAALLDGKFISDVGDDSGGRVTNYDGALADVFSCIAKLGDDGCGFEQHLESIRLALDPANLANHGFLRDNALLAVILIADEDDCSAENGLFDTSDTTLASTLGPVHSFRCFDFGVTCDEAGRTPGARTNCGPNPESDLMYEVEEYVDFLVDLKGPGRTYVAAIAGEVDPVVVVDGVDGAGHPVVDLEFSCTVGSAPNYAASARPPIRLDAFRRGFPASNSLTSICDDDLGAAIERIGDDFLKLFHPCLEGELADRNPSLDGVQPECSVTEFEGPGAQGAATVLHQCPSAPPSGGDLPCWRFAESPEHCGFTPTQLEVVIERADGATPSTYLDVQCVVE